MKNGLSSIMVSIVISVLFHNALPFVGFGFLDNAIMIVAVSKRIPSSIPLCFRLSGLKLLL